MPTANFSSFSRRSRGRRSEGFTYVSHGETGPMRDASEGVVVRIQGRGPPWIVVDEDIASVIAANWPGQLWRVGIVEAANELDQRPHGGVPLKSARYTRAIAVEIIKREDIGKLFGREGGKVLRVIEAASEIDRQRAELLCGNRDVEASAACDRVWRAWMRAQSLPDVYPDSLDGTLLIGVSGSPINRGLTVLHQAVFERAKALDGEAAVVTDDDDNVWLAPPWDGAATSLMDAALALGAPDFVDKADRDVLLKPWMLLS